MKKDITKYAPSELYNYIQNDETLYLLYEDALQDETLDNIILLLDEYFIYTDIQLEQLKLEFENDLQIKKEREEEDKKLECSYCLEKFDKNELIEGLDGKLYCESCVETIKEESFNVIIYIENGLYEKAIFTEEFGVHHIEGTFLIDNIFDYEELPEPIKAGKWIRTDGWRGYQDWELHDEYISVITGWTTGYIDDWTKRKQDFNDLIEKLMNGKIECPVELWVAMGRTSNVFSNTIDIIIHKKDKEKFIKWTEKQKLDIEYMLS